MAKVHYTSTHVVTLCIFSFFVGRFLQLPGMPDGSGHGPTVVRSDRKLLLDTAEEGAQKELAVKAASEPHNFKSFEEMLDASGMLADKPAIKAGASGKDGYIVQPFQLLSWAPRAYLYPSFMDKAKCDHVIEIAAKRLGPSGLAFKKGDNPENTAEIRTSQGTFMARSDDPGGVLTWIEEKIAALTMLPVAHGEAFNILRYDNSQHYDSHYDAFDEESYGKQYSQRVATVLVYLTDVEEGGETVFLFEGRGGLQRLNNVDYKACDTGIKYKPRAGDALLFWSMHPNATLDKHALHGGCPVVTGTKWVMTKWLRDQCSWGPEHCAGW